MLIQNLWFKNLMDTGKNSRLGDRTASTTLAPLSQELVKRHC